MRLLSIVASFLLVSAASAQQKKVPTKAVELFSEDTAAYRAAPVGFDKPNETMLHGTVDSVWYESKTVGTKRQMMVYTPPGYDLEFKYPVLYLLHGIGGDDKEWLDQGAAATILDNLYTEKKLVPMIVVMPNGRAMKNDSAVGNMMDSVKVKAFATFEADLLDDVIPYIESNYHILQSKENRAIAGLSMGGGQALNFGLLHPETFGWIGGFSPAPNTKKPEELFIRPKEAASNIKLLWISCGDKDPLISTVQGLHKTLKLNNVRHVYHIDKGGHEFSVWKNDLYIFSRMLFRK